MPMLHQNAVPKLENPSEVILSCFNVIQFIHIKFKTTSYFN